MAIGMTDSKHYTDIAEAIRAKKGSTETLKPEQMAGEIGGIVTADGLPKAEEASFGTTAEYEYGVISYTGELTKTSSPGNPGYKFKPVTNFAVYGFRYIYGDWPSEATRLILYDVTNATQLAILIVEPERSTEWQEVMLESPVNLVAGNQYLVYMRGVYGSYCAASNVSFNTEKMSGVSTTTGTTGATASTNWGCMDIIIGQAGTETTSTKYTVKASTMTDLADAVRNKSGNEGTLSPAQMIDAIDGLDVTVTLQDKTVTPTNAQQFVTCDSGYDGLGTVTVEPASVTAVLQEKTATPTAEAQEILPDEGYEGMSKVTVEPVVVTNIVKGAVISSVTYQFL